MVIIVAIGFVRHHGGIVVAANHAFESVPVIVDLRRRREFPVFLRSSDSLTITTGQPTASQIMIEEETGNTEPFRLGMVMQWYVASSTLLEALDVAKCA